MIIPSTDVWPRAPLEATFLPSHLTELLSSFIRRHCSPPSAAIVVDLACRRRHRHLSLPLLYVQRRQSLVSLFLQFAQSRSRIVCDLCRGRSFSRGWSPRVENCRIQPVYRLSADPLSILTSIYSPLLPTARLCCDLSFFFVLRHFH